MTVTPPTVRQDLMEEEDYIEEVARLFGYDKLPVTLPKGNTEAGMPKERSLRNLMRESLCAMGLNEIQTYSFVSPKCENSRRLMGKRICQDYKSSGRRKLRYENHTYS